MDQPDTVSANSLTPETEKTIQKIQLIAFDFDGVFTDNMVYTFEDGREAVKCSRSEGLGIQKLKDQGIDMVVISTEVNSVVAARCRKLGLQCIHGCENKLSTLMEIAEQKNISLDHVAYVGNDINDIPCLGMPVFLLLSMMPIRMSLVLHDSALLVQGGMVQSGRSAIFSIRL